LNLNPFLTRARTSRVIPGAGSLVGFLVMDEIRARASRSLALLLAALLCTSSVRAAVSAPASASSPEIARHVLNRLAYGPRPAEVDRVAAQGVERWIAQQLHPEKIDDSAVRDRLAGLETLRLSEAELYERFEKPVREARRMMKKASADGDSEDAAREQTMEKLRRSIPPEDRPRRVVEELTAARLIRAVESPRQLEEVLVDFWMNHFNVDARKGPDRVFVASFERDVIRPRVFGRFEDLLQETAKSPAMLWYLDNARSVAEPANRTASGDKRVQRFLQRSDPEIRAQMPPGINENYARELMELHTLGVDGGYTQKDVTELARLLTGWGIDRRGFGSGGFQFRSVVHDAKEKVVLGHRFPAGGGLEEGERMISILANHPATARHISEKLCRKFVADEPPADLVGRVASVFTATRGDLRETVRAVVTSPEFFDPRHREAKVKTPLEFAVSAVRATGARTDGKGLARELAGLGQPLYLCQPPTGYAEEAEAWISSGALLARMNFATALLEGRVAGTRAAAAPAGVTAQVLGGPDFQKQ
jgi:uncharacterized protein (DUF1800 family)